MDKPIGNKDIKKRAKGLMSIPPILRQYKDIKARHPDELLLFRMGDFYELFFDDAKIASEVLGIVLTSKPLGKDHRVPLAGIPVKAAENYISKLLSRGYKVAICEQTGEGKGLMKRDVVEVITPGTVLSPSLLEEKSHHYIASFLSEGERAGVALADLTTTDFSLFEASKERAIEELEKLNVKEVIVKENERLESSFYITRLKEIYFSPYNAEEELKKFFNVTTLEGFGIQSLSIAQKASIALIKYLREKKGEYLPNFNRINIYPIEETLYLDPQTIRNLELISSIRPGEGKTLLDILDRTRTPMGGRKLKEALLSPYRSREKIISRQMRVEALIEHPETRKTISDILKKMGDIERVTTRTITRRASPKEVKKLGEALILFPQIVENLSTIEPFKNLISEVPDVHDIGKKIVETLSDDPPSQLSMGGVIREGVDSQLDELRELAHSGKEKILELEWKERERTGISSLRIGYNSVFGYYIEVTKANLHLVPSNYVRKQTLTGAERFITEELKSLEERILGAEEKALRLEGEIFRNLLFQISRRSRDIKLVANFLAELDLCLSLAEVAISSRYVKPLIREDGQIRIIDGRHPVVEQTGEEAFVPNDTIMDLEDNRVFIITGPNMAGKSTYLRQVALIVILAQIGSFVPAKEAELGLVDRIFTRIGASDDLARGVSTFMAEMVETAQILHNATKRSLVILDEVGRGTSTYDGMAIAWAVIEYIAKKIRAKTLFATHYHELAELGRRIRGVKNFTVAVREWGDEIIFLRKLIPGETDRSYGIHVAKLAGLPEPVIERAKEILLDLERMGTRVPLREGNQLSLFQPTKESLLRKKLEGINLDELTPKDALNLLYEIKEEIEK
jgi:DNA mismatch repair protein MutS